MLEWTEARELVSRQCRCLPPRQQPREQALGHVLAEDVISRVWVPAYDKSLVDGFAVQADQFQAGRRDWEVVDEIMAGSTPNCDLLPGQAARIMTGAPVPQGADCVVMLEHTQPSPCGGALRHVSVGSLTTGQNVMRRGKAMEPGRLVLGRGQRLRAIELGILAELGVTRVATFPRPQIGLLQTGDELVGDDETLVEGKIRNSNGPLLAGLTQESGGDVAYNQVVPDRRESLAAAIERGLELDVLVVSGGVSMGDLDLVPGQLDAAGVTCAFHGLRLRPGKPMWFGYRDQGARRTLVFGLPGNPVSGLVCFHLFVRPALRALAGWSHAWQPLVRRGRLATAYSHRGPRSTFWPARWTETPDRETVVDPLPWLGSADPFTLAQANGFVAFAAGDREYPAGSEVECWQLD